MILCQCTVYTRGVSRRQAGTWLHSARMHSAHGWSVLGRVARTGGDRPQADGLAGADCRRPHTWAITPARACGPAYTRTHLCMHAPRVSLVKPRNGQGQVLWSGRGDGLMKLIASSPRTNHDVAARAPRIACTQPPAQGAIGSGQLVATGTRTPLHIILIDGTLVASVAGEKKERGERSRRALAHQET